MRYYFNIRDGYDSLDPEGTEFDTLDQARAEAFRLRGEVLRGAAGSLWSDERWAMQVTDGPNRTGRVLFTLDFSATDPV